jgi:peptidylprolyl isomerase
MRKLLTSLAAFALSAQVALAGNPMLEIEITGEASGTVVIELFADSAPGHAERISTLAASGAYDGVVFHRVIEGFMAQTGDVQYGRGDDFSLAGTGGSDMPDLKAEFSDEISFERGTVGMARARNPHSANSQFFIMFAPAPHLNGQYTVVGQVVSGMEVVDAVKRGGGSSGAVRAPADVMARVTLKQGE